MQYPSVKAILSLQQELPLWVSNSCRSKGMRALKCAYFIETFLLLWNPRWCLQKSHVWHSCGILLFVGGRDLCRVNHLKRYYLRAAERRKQYPISRVKVVATRLVFFHWTNFPICSSYLCLHSWMRANEDLFCPLYWHLLLFTCSRIHVVATDTDSSEGIH